jgi:prepilin-type N-terminal cleavage/methylation domain-containing protein
MTPRQSSSRSAFTLVELLVVIAIIGVLVALLLPAVQAAREAGRRTECLNHLRQIGLAALSYHDTHGVYPMGRDRTDQRSLSWAFRLLPFVEQQAMHESHQANRPAHDAQNVLSMRTPVALYACPSRRSAAADRDFDNDDNRPVVTGAASLGDYAACAGHDYRTGTASGIFGSDAEAQTVGPIYSFSRVSGREVTDGTSHTFVAGERYIPREQAGIELTHYQAGDTAFLAGDLPRSILCGTQGGLATSDADFDLELSQFGSEHPGATLFVLLDGHAAALAVETEQGVLDALATIAGEELVR